jgi:hypothetical protein
MAGIIGNQMVACQDGVLATTCRRVILTVGQSMIRKSMPSGYDPTGENRYSEKIMLRQKQRLALNSQGGTS